MQLDPNDLLLFSRVVAEGSFSRAADRLNMPKSTLNRLILQKKYQILNSTYLKLSSLPRRLKQRARILARIRVQ